jgi:hypothetical protein
MVLPDATQPGHTLPRTLVDGALWQSFGLELDANRLFARIAAQQLQRNWNGWWAATHKYPLGYELAKLSRGLQTKDKILKLLTAIGR